MAVETDASTPTGILYNEVPDRISDAAVFIGAGYAVGGDPTLGWAAALVAVFVAYVRVQNKVAGAAQDYCGPMAKPMRMALVCVAAAFLALTPVSWHPAWGRGEQWGLVTGVLIAIVAGGAVTGVRRLVRAARILREQSS